MFRGKFSLEDVLHPPPESTLAKSKRRPPGETDRQSPGEFDFLPTPGDPYKAHSRPSSKPETTLHVLLGDGSARGFAFAGFDSIDLLPAADAGGGPVIIVRFAGIVARQVLITGRNLSLVHVYIAQHRIAWLRELPPKRGFTDAGEAVITGITIKAVDGFY
jgi:hypothetical protein